MGYRKQSKKTRHVGIAFPKLPHVVLLIGTILREAICKSLESSKLNADIFKYIARPLKKILV